MLSGVFAVYVMALALESTEPDARAAVRSPISQ